MTYRLLEQQLEICRKYGAEFCESDPFHRLGAADNVRTDLIQLNGLRHPPQNDFTGWFIYAGEEFSQDPEFFKPYHVHHLSDFRKEAVKYLGLAPGWRFLIAPGYEDVWFDENLLQDD